MAVAQYSPVATTNRSKAPQVKSIPCADCGIAIWRGSKRCKACHTAHVLLESHNRFTCEQCGTRFNKRLGGRHLKLGYVVRWCSRKCRREWALAHKAAPYTRLRKCRACPALIAPTKSMCAPCKEASKPQPKLKDAPRCAECAVEYRRHAKWQRFCSSACRQAAKARAARASRKAHKEKYGSKWRSIAKARGVIYEPVNIRRVFDRDGWRCQICGKATPKERRGSYYPNAPELDHRIPLSKGGGHTYANTQCACRACNGAKSNKTEAGQMPLFMNNIQGRVVDKKLSIDLR